MNKSPETYVSTEEILLQSYEAIDQMHLGERDPAVKLALKALLVVRGALNQAVINETIYSRIAKYVRASNAQTLPGIVHDVLRNISPEFIAYRALGAPVQDIYSPEAAPEAMQLLQQETIPLVILMKKVYQQFSPQEAPASLEEEANA